MGWTVLAKKTANDAILAKLQDGSGTAAIKVYTSGDILLHAFALNTTTSSVNATTGVLTLLEGDASLTLYSGQAAYARLFTENNDSLYDAMPVAEGSSAISGYCVLSTLTFTQNGSASLITATIG